MNTQFEIRALCPCRQPLLRPSQRPDGPYVLLDRDGTIIAERHYLSRPEQVEFVPGAIEGLRELSRLGCGLVIVTNQSGVGRGLFEVADVVRVHDRLIGMLAEEGIRLNGLYFCPHTPGEQCLCRKPRRGLVDAAAGDLGFDPAAAFVVGDKACDVDLGRAVGATTLLVKSGYGVEVHRRGEAHPDFFVDDLAAAAQVIRVRLVEKEGKRR